MRRERRSRRTKRRMQRKPESAGEFGEGTALVAGEEREAREDCDASGESGGGVVESFKREGTRGQAGCGKDDESERDGREIPGEDSAKRCAQHPCERRIEDETRLACAVVGAGRPVGIKNAVTPRVEAVEPRDEMDIEVVAAGAAANELRDHGDSGGEEDDGGAEEVPRSAKREGSPPSRTRTCPWGPRTGGTRSLARPALIPDP